MYVLEAHARMEDKYKLYQMQDSPGRYILKDVEIFAEKSFFKEEVTPALFDKILQNTQSLISEGHLPQVHLGHHTQFKNGETPLIGFMTNLRVKKHDKYGRVMVADLVDILKTDAELFSLGRYPYRSIELLKKTKGQERILTLGILQDVPPQIQFKRIDAEFTDMYAPVSPETFNSITAYQVHFSNQEPNMDKEKKEDKKMYSEGEMGKKDDEIKKLKAKLAKYEEDSKKDKEDKACEDKDKADKKQDENVKGKQKDDKEDTTEKMNHQDLIYAAQKLPKMSDVTLYKLVKGGMTREEIDELAKTQNYNNEDHSETLNTEVVASDGETQAQAEFKAYCKQYGLQESENALKFYEEIR